MSPATLCITTTRIPTVQGAPKRKPELEVVSISCPSEVAGGHPHPDHLLTHPGAVGLEVVLQDLSDHALFKGLPFAGDQGHLVHLVEADQQQGEKQRQQHQRRQHSASKPDCRVQETVLISSDDAGPAKNSLSAGNVPAERCRKMTGSGGYMPSLVRA